MQMQQGRCAKCCQGLLFLPITGSGHERLYRPVCIRSALARLSDIVAAR
jgi:hypothetical protein